MVPRLPGPVLFVWTELEDDAHRIISARWASEREEALYQAYMDDRL
jgi:uncharacterized DUF497 family protein